MLSAIGDSLGWITEFEKSSDNVYKKYNVKKVDSFLNWEKFVGGRFNGFLDKITSGSYSDDTQLLLAVGRSIKPNGFVDNVFFSKVELPAWLLYARGAGRTIKNAAAKITRKSASWNNNFFTFNAGNQKIDYRESGANGAAMRILPIALTNYNNLEKNKENNFSNSIITHGHPRAIVGAILYGIAINEMLKLKEKEFTYDFYLTNIGKDFEKKFELTFINKPDYKKWLDEWNKGNTDDFIHLYNKCVEEALHNLRIIYKAIRDNKEPKEVLEEIGCFLPSTKGSGISTVIAGIYLAAIFYRNPEDAIINAVNLYGSDTDSIAAFAGGLLGSLYEDDIIPQRWKDVQDSKYLYSFAINLFKISTSQNLNEMPSQIYLGTKLFSDISTDSYTENEDIIFNPLGKGKITKIDRQKTLTRGKYNLIIDIEFEIGQTCRFSKILDINKSNQENLF
jgi:ADP-ribosylglycohydrolase